MKAATTKIFPLNATKLITARTDVNIVETNEEQLADEEFDGTSVELFIVTQLERST